ncbi:hypothetical protein [Prevotella sp. 10(H)]|uniref:hypothetical protein n=1 Tax=Prevotella sp. 10(H) TaxID=1158294 RepID=UPI0004A6CB1F|nr:hypothetical protein [Prevotella sp. 10(H)]
MLKITTNAKNVTFVTGDNKYEKPFNSVDYIIASDDTVILQHVSTRRTFLSERIEDIELNGEVLTPQNVDEKLNEALFF